jgi:hypothetical protein
MKSHSEIEAIGAEAIEAVDAIIDAHLRKKIVAGTAANDGGTAGSDAARTERIFQAVLNAGSVASNATGSATGSATSSATGSAHPPRNNVLRFALPALAVAASLAAAIALTIFVVKNDTAGTAAPSEPVRSVERTTGDFAGLEFASEITSDPELAQAIATDLELARVFADNPALASFAVSISSTQ